MIIKKQKKKKKRNEMKLKYTLKYFKIVEAFI